MSSLFAAVRPQVARVSTATLGIRTYRPKTSELHWKRTGRRRAQYQFRVPRYFRGPLHPIQPPKPSEPNSREFVPGPFSRERLEDHYHNTIASDLLVLTYTHQAPGVEPKKNDIKQRLREWDDSSPYHKNRPLRGPRGGTVLGLLDKPRTFRNVPGLTGITVHTMVKGAMQDNAHLAVAGMVVQSITGVRGTVVFAKKSVAPFDLRAGRAIGIKANMQGQLAYRFLGNLIDVVMPRIKEYKGAKGTSGDSSGNITFGFTPEQVILFPEIEVNYDMYPPKMIPGMHITVHTSANNDKEARKLLQGFGIPFYGKIRD
ncbi:mitochondrial ribosomal protein-like protein subunit L7 [Pyronema domesticum]|uniref:Large ribosomal subunit protein uL5m n=1 Tax=Pyronema omphalodes (strain CBS 100304) TaxID=1076935 RepID=U4LFE1_PYROM|nr:mitochondrial ribosomal protein-like protein subunit L7 [Pyronema domesticum]CCX13699.1 Similar to 54S ribosomal protein L7, mitochondrial; acc. no. P36519 [Pyronema omphalodes CBS 100304]